MYLKNQTISNLIPRLIGQWAIRPCGGRGLDAISIFIHIFLMVMASRYDHRGGQTGFKSKRQIADVLGLNNKDVTHALESLERVGLIGWIHELGGYTVNQEIFGDWVEDDGSRSTGTSIQAFARVAEVFFDQKLRQTHARRMHFVEKLLILSLVISADEQGLVSGFDIQRNCAWLGMEPEQLIKKLESLHCGHGLVLTYKAGLPLQDGITYKYERLIVNIMHPWLQGASGAYCYCQMHGPHWVAVRGDVPKSLAHLQERDNKLEDGEPWLVMLSNEDQVLGRFEESVGNTLYGHWLARAQTTFVKLGREKTLREIKTHLEKNPGMSCKMAWEMDDADAWQLLSYWYSVGYESKSSYEQFYFHGFYACHALVMEHLCGKVVGDTGSLEESHQKWEEFIQSHPLIMMQRELPNQSLAYHYLDFIRKGGGWVFRLVMGEAMKAINLYRAEFKDAKGDIEMVFVTYLLDSRIVKANQNKSLNGRLTGAMLFRLVDKKEENAKEMRFGMDIPEVRQWLPDTEDLAVCYVKGKKIIKPSKSYPFNDDSFKAFVGQLRNFWIYGLDNMKSNKYNKIDTKKSETWLEYIKKA